MSKMHPFGTEEIKACDPGMEAQSKEGAKLLQRVPRLVVLFLLCNKYSGLYT